MPTPAKLVGAVLFAALAWAVAEAIVATLLPEGTRTAWFREALAAAAFVIGWRTIGAEATGRMRRGTTMTRAATAGIAAAAQLLVLGVVMHSFGRMIANSLDGKYTQIGRAWTAWMDFLWADVVLLSDGAVLGLLFGGGAVVGLLAGAMGRRVG